MSQDHNKWEWLPVWWSSRWWYIYVWSWALVCRMTGPYIILYISISMKVHNEVVWPLGQSLKNILLISAVILARIEQSAPGCSVAMATNAVLVGLADEWEGTLAVRERLRVSKALFPAQSGGKALEANIRGAEQHVDVLIPLLKKLVNPETLDIGMCAIPCLEREWLAS